MSIEVGSLLISMGADIARLSDDMGKARRTVDGAMSEIKRSAAAAKSALEMIGVGVSAGAFSAWIKSSIDLADHMVDLSKTTSLTVEQLAGVSLAAKKSGSDLDGTAEAIAKLAENMGKNADKFAAVGITAKDPLEAFGQLADVFNAIEDPQLRAAFAAEALGKSWKSTAPLLAEGSERISEMVERGKDLSGDIKKAADMADQFNDKMAELKTVMGGLGGQMAVELSNPLMVTADALVELNKGGKEFLPIGAGIRTVLETFIVLGANAGYVFKQIGIEIGGIGAQLAALARGDVKGFADIGRMMKEDAAAARREIDAFNDRVLSRQQNGIEHQIDAGRGKGSVDVRGFINPEKGGGGGAKGQEHDVALRNWLWQVDEFHKERVRMQREADQELDRTNAEMARRALEAQRIVADTDPIYKATLAWDELLSLVNDGLLTGEQAAKAYQKQFDPMAKEGEDSFKRLESAVRGWGNEFTDVMTRMVRTGKLEWGNLADSIINDLIRIQIQQSITDPMVNAAKGMSFSSLGSMFSFGSSGSGGITSMADMPGSAPIMSFDGGGYTGNGSRSGGLDGKGGFWAMLHPKETVIDHASGGRGSGITLAPTYNISIDSRSDRSEVYGMVMSAVQAGNAMLIDSLERQGRLA